MIGDRSLPHSISERRESRFSPSGRSSSASPVCTKHPRQSPLCTRTTPQQCGHSSGSCWCIPSESVMLLKSIFHHPSWLLNATKCAPFVHYRKASRRPETASLVMIGWGPIGTSLAKARRRRSLHVRSSVTPCTSTSTESAGRSSKKCLSARGKGLVFTRLFQLRFGRANYCAPFLQYVPQTHPACLGDYDFLATCEFRFYSR